MAVRDIIQAAAGVGGGDAEVFSTYIYTGSGSAQTITNGINLAGEGGLVWVKNRTNVVSHRLYDTERGVYKELYTDLINAQVDRTSTTAGLSSFNSNGFSFGNSDYNGTNQSGINYASWTFRKAPEFFDVVAYTGNGVTDQAVPHNLTIAPELYIMKTISTTGDWWTYTTAIDGTHDYSKLNTTDAFGDSIRPLPDNTNIYVGASTNTNGAAYIAYLFASCPGVSKIGTYTGTGANIDVDCGFSVGARFVLIKRTNTTGDWSVWDSVRGIVSGNDPYLLMNSNAAEVNSEDDIDPLASGFTVKSGAFNVSGHNYIFLAIA